MSVFKILNKAVSLQETILTRGRPGKPSSIPFFEPGCGWATIFCSASSRPIFLTIFRSLSEPWSEFHSILQQNPGLVHGFTDLYLLYLNRVYESTYGITLEVEDYLARHNVETTRYVNLYSKGIGQTILTKIWYSDAYYKDVGFFTKHVYPSSRRVRLLYFYWWWRSSWYQWLEQKHLYS